MKFIFNWPWLRGQRLAAGRPRPWAPVALGLALGVLGARPATAAASAAVVERAELIMGTVARIASDDPAMSPDAYEAAFAALRAVDEDMSLYRPQSELVRVNIHAARHPEPVGPELFALLARARELSLATDGAFDVTILPLLRLWGAYRELDYLGAGGVHTVGFGGMVLDPVARTVSFRQPGMGVDLGGIAKGFALDRATAALRAAGVRRARLDLGGILALLGSGPDGDWDVAVRDPRAPDTALGVIKLAPDTAVSTSGNYARDFPAEGWRAPSHIYDPRTGRPVTATLAVTVWARDATTADALSTALLVLGSDTAGEILARQPGAGALFVDGDGRTTLSGEQPRSWQALQPAHLETRTNPARRGHDNEEETCRGEPGRS